MAYKLYEGTSAYKIDEYYDYTRQAQEKQDQRKVSVKRRHAINIKRLSIVLGLVFAVATAFLYTNAVLMETSSKVNDLTDELEDIKVRNTQVSFDIVSGVDYNVVEQKAISEFGMQHPESYQNVYVDVVQSDYAEVANEKEQSRGFVEGLISGVQAFLAYIE